MRHDRPSASDLDINEPTALANSRARSETPTWPGTDERRRRALDARQISTWGVSPLAFGVSLGANIVLLFGLIGMILLIQAGTFSSGGAFGSSTRGGAVSSPAATSSPVSSPSPNAPWLQITPSSVQLGCESGQRTRFVTLQNTGTAKVRWQAKFSLPAQQAGMTMSPQLGELAAGKRVSIQLQNTTSSKGSQGVSGRQGVITFTPTATDDSQGSRSDIGAPAMLSYTTTGCH